MLKPSEQRLRKLDHFLSRPDLGDDVMLLSEFDGFVAGVAVCPDFIMPSEWLAEVWGEDGPVFDSERQANEVVQLIMATLNDVLRKLGRPRTYAPLLPTGAGEHHLEIDRMEAHLETGVVGQLHEAVVAETGPLPCPPHTRRAARLGKGGIIR